MAESAIDKELEKHEIQEPQNELPISADAPERLCLKETFETNDDLPEGLRRSERARNPTEKMRVHQDEEAKKKEKKLLSMYEKWKLQIRKARDQLKTYMQESELWLLIDELKKDKIDMMII